MNVKNFVLDTNVILHDHKCIYNFQENNIFLPIVVLEELDKFKKGNDQLNFNAREFIRELDKIATNTIFSEGVSLGKDLGKLSILTNTEYPAVISNAFSEKNADHKILAVLLALTDKNPEVKNILVSKDINLRMKAKSLGLLAEDYTNDKVESVDIFEKAHDTFEGIDSELIDRLYASPNGIPFEDLHISAPISANDCFTLKSERASALVRYEPDTKNVVTIKKERAFGIEARNAEQTFALDTLLNEDIKLVAITGKAGTGKTLLALAAALQQHEKYKQILLARPIIALANKDIGFLPGNEKQKIAPYMQPLFDNLNVIKRQFKASARELHLIDEMQKSEQLVIEALAFIRGRSLGDTYFIVDEAQNLTPHEIKTIITRAGERTKMVFTGDIQQIDTPYLDAQSNGLVYMIDRMRNQDIFAHINLVKGERSYLSELASNLL